MANTCFNELQFTGQKDQVKQANQFLAGLSRDEWGGVQVIETDGYFQDIDFSQGRFNFGTRWVPYIEAAKNIADRFNAGFILDYSESMNSLYGQARYENGKVKDIRVELEDFKKIAYDQKHGVYEYKGGLYSNLEPLARRVLKEKIEHANPIKHRLQNKKRAR